MIGSSSLSEGHDVSPRQRENFSGSGLPPHQATGITSQPIVGVSDWARQIKNQIRRFAPTSLPVLITGSTGTGKELIARAIHANSPRCDKPFIAINTAAVVGQLFESHMFGHVQGAFSGAHCDRVGCFRMAEGGTVFLDEIGELNLDLQPKLLRILQEGVVVPVGSDEEHTIDVRIVAATNRALSDEVARGNFREDLFYRLAVVTLHAISLAERTEDIEVIANALLAQQSIKYGLPHKRLAPAALHQLRNFGWPGNVRQLQNVLELAAVVAEAETIESDDLQLGNDALSCNPESHEVVTSKPQSLQHPGLVNDRWLTMEAMQQWHLEKTMAFTHNNQSEAARLLGMDRSVLRRRLKKFDQL